MNGNNIRGVVFNNNIGVVVFLKSTRFNIINLKITFFEIVLVILIFIWKRKTMK